jgi:hypothetical protein
MSKGHRKGNIRRRVIPSGRVSNVRGGAFGEKLPADLARALVIGAAHQGFSKAQKNMRTLVQVKGSQIVREAIFEDLAERGLLPKVFEDDVKVNLYADVGKS